MDPVTMEPALNKMVRQNYLSGEWEGLRDRNRVPRTPRVWLRLGALNQ